MSEEIVPEAVEAPPKPKQYLVMVDELSRAIIGKIMPGILFVEIEGMAMEGNANHMLLVNPVPKVEPVTVPIEGVKADDTVMAS